MNILTDIPKNEILEALLNEYKRKIILYKMTDEKMKKKYKMTFKEFDKKNIVKTKGYTWNVEKDAMEWEHSIEGIKSLEKKIKQIKPK